MIVGTPKFSMDMQNTISAPEAMAGVATGSVTVRNTRQGDAPRLRADSSSERSTELIAAETMRKTKGKNWSVYTRTPPCQP